MVSVTPMLCLPCHARITQPTVAVVPRHPALPDPASGRGLFLSGLRRLQPSHYHFLRQHFLRATSPIGIVSKGSTCRRGPPYLFPEGLFTTQSLVCTFWCFGLRNFDDPSKEFGLVHVVDGFLHICCIFELYISEPSMRIRGVWCIRLGDLYLDNFSEGQECIKDMAMSGSLRETAHVYGSLPSRLIRHGSDSDSGEQRLCKVVSLQFS